MKACLAYIKDLIADPIFFRVCLWIWGLSFAGFAGVSLISWHPADTYEWFGFILVFSLGCGGAFLMGLAFFGSNKSIDKASNSMNDGGDILGLIFALVVFLFALPITALLRLFTSSPKK